MAQLTDAAAAEQRVREIVRREIAQAELDRRIMDDLMRSYAPHLYK